MVICLERGANYLGTVWSTDATAVPKPHRLVPQLSPDLFYFSGRPTGLPGL